MDQPFAHKTGEKLLSEVRQLFQHKPIFHRRAKPFVFVCGGSTAKRSKKLRGKFLSWAKGGLSEVVFVLAEDAYNYTSLYDPPELVNLSEFEEVIGEIADCVVVFPESAGSFAELGLFSGHEKIRQKTLIINTVAAVSSESFINLGPVATIDKHSFLKPSLPIAPKRGRYDFASVRTRLERVIKTNRRKAFTYGPYRSLTLFDKFLVILEMIYLFQFVTLEDLEKCLIWIFDGALRKDILPLLSVLLGMDYILSKDGYYMLRPNRTSLLEFEDVQIQDVRVRVLAHYERNYPTLWRQYQKAKK
jgi:hypothetical protein